MSKEELLQLLDQIQAEKAENSTLECKAAKSGCPSKLYPTLSSFSNQDSGGIIVFGVDEDAHFEECGVYNAQDLQKRVKEQCLQMQPAVRALFTVVEKHGKLFVCSEIPGIDLSERPCFYRGVGVNKGSYIRVGDSDEPMTPYEIYSYEAFRKKYQDDIREVPRATLESLNKDRLGKYIDLLKKGKPNFESIKIEQIYELMSIMRNKVLTLSSVMIFSPYPQAYFPQLCIIAVSVPGTEIGDLSPSGERFLDNQRIEGSIEDMLDGALRFVERNMKRRTVVDPDTGKRSDRTEYPLLAVREALLNSLVHRDYSMHTEGMPIQLNIFSDRIEISNPGGLYGRIRVDQLGKVQPDTRNPVLASALEVLRITENRYSGIPTMYREMREYGLPDPVFSDERGMFKVCFKNHVEAEDDYSEIKQDILRFCNVPRTINEICEHLNLRTEWYVKQKYIKPLLEDGLLKQSKEVLDGKTVRYFVTVKQR